MTRGCGRIYPPSKACQRREAVVPVARVCGGVATESTCRQMVEGASGFN